MPISKIILRVFLAVSGLVVISQEVFPQGRKDLTGIGVQISTPPLYNSSIAIFNSMEMQPDILVSTWISDNFALEPSVGILAQSDETFWRFGLAFINHFGQEKLSPFILFRAKAYLLSTDNWSSTNFLFSVAGGGE